VRTRIEKAGSRRAEGASYSSPRCEYRSPRYYARHEISEPDKAFGTSASTDNNDASEFVNSVNDKVNELPSESTSESFPITEIPFCISNPGRGVEGLGVLLELRQTKTGVLKEMKRDQWISFPCQTNQTFLAWICVLL